jgi:hypothetical protein
MSPAAVTTERVRLLNSGGKFKRCGLDHRLAVMFGTLPDGSIAHPTAAAVRR